MINQNFLVSIINLVLGINASIGCPINYRKNHIEVSNREYKVVSYYNVDSTNIDGYREFLVENGDLLDSSNIYSRTILISRKTNDTLFNVSNMFCQSVTISNDYIICASTLNNCYNMYNLVILGLSGKVLYAESFDQTGLNIVYSKLNRTIRNRLNEVLLTDSQVGNYYANSNSLWIPFDSKSKYNVLNEFWNYGAITLHPKLGNVFFSASPHRSPIYWYSEKESHMKLRWKNHFDSYVFTYRDALGKRCRWRFKQLT
jgi:hypothetical protein